MTLVVSVVAFTFSAAGAVDGADIMAVADITQRHIMGCGGAVRQAKDVHCGVKASPSTCPPVVGPAGADGTEVFFVTIISLQDGEIRHTDKSSNNLNMARKYSNRICSDTNIYRGETCRHARQSANRIQALSTQRLEIYTNTQRCFQ